MSRHTRASRPLIALLGLLIVLGVFFTVHKLKKVHAAEAKKPNQVASVLDVSSANKSPAAKQNVTTQPAASVEQPAAPKLDSSTLVTQTPTEKVSSAATAKPAERHASDSTESGDTNPPPQASETSAPNQSGTTSSDTTTLANRAAAVPSIQVSTASLADAKAKADSGDLLAARQMANDALASGRLSESEADAARHLLIDLNKTIVFSNRKFPDDPWGGVYKVESGERMSTIAAKHSITWELISRVNGVEPRKMRQGQSLKVFKGPFHAVVTKHLFRMDIYQGNPGGQGSLFVTSFPVGLGKDNSTPTGLWLCKAGNKIRHPTYYPPSSTGGAVLGPNDPKNPLAGYWIAIEGQDGQAVGKESYGIHGTIDPDSIGKQESMGCIRLRAEDISWVFDLLVDGKSKVMVKE